MNKNTGGYYTIFYKKLIPKINLFKQSKFDYHILNKISYHHYFDI